MNENSNDATQNQGLIIVDSLLNRTTKETVALIKAAVDSGDNDPAYVGVVLKKFAKIAEEVKKDEDLQNTIEIATKLHQTGSTKTFQLYGAKITIADGGFWDYSNTTDPVLERLLEIQTHVKEQIKLRQTELQAKAIAWERKADPANIIEFGIKPFTVTWEEIPELKWDEAIGSVDTNPPIKRGKEQLRYSL